MSIRERFFSSRQAIVPLIGIIAVYLLSTALSYLYFSRIQVGENGYDKEEVVQRNSEFDLSPIPTPEVPTTYNVLLLGHGGAGHSGGALADTMIVVHVDPQLKKAALISIPRDLWITLPQENGSKVNKKLNHALALGGGELAKDAVSTVIGMPIQYFVSVSFDGMEAAINTLGGVEVDVPVTFDDYWYPVRGRELETCGMTAEEIQEITNTMSGFEGEKMFPCRYEHIHYDAGETSMDGASALKFVRSRHSTQHGGDFSRSQRQFALLVGIKEKLLTLGALDDLPKFFKQLVKMVQTDIDQRIAQLLVDVIGDVTSFSLVRIQLTEENVLVASRSYDGQAILLPKAGEGQWKEIHSFIQNQLPSD